MLARALEAAGLVTTSLVLLKEHAQRTKPPRALFVPFPYGYALGKADDAEFQLRVLQSALALLEFETGPVMSEFLEECGAPPRLTQASGQKRVGRADDAAGELTAMRGYYEQWVLMHGGRTAVGNSGVPSRRFRGLVRYIEAYIADKPCDLSEIPVGVKKLQFLRQAADDLKAFMFEARMQQHPNEQDNCLHEWFWGQTAVGALLERLAEKLKEQGEDRAAFGIAR